MKILSWVENRLATIHDTREEKSGSQNGNFFKKLLMSGDREKNIHCADGAGEMDVEGGIAVIRVQC
ncbi:MAG: hypothetical protein JNL77_02330 [Nitrosomonas sp.]|nr:hypothetical protein [Nitrosomonas sp.]